MLSNAFSKWSDEMFTLIIMSMLRGFNGFEIARFACESLGMEAVSKGACERCIAQVVINECIELNE